ncbi:hypothetical protein Tco_1389664 [Tanacetum coccineum]
MPEDLYAYVVAAFQAPTSLDYVPGSKGPEQEPLSPEFVLEPVYPKFMPPEDEVFPAEEQPLPAAVSPTADSLGYIADSDLEEDEEDPKEDPIDYPAGRGDDDDDDDESSDDDGDNDDDVDEDEDEEEEEHPALADSVPPPVHQIVRLLAIPSPPPSPISLWSSPLPQIPSPPLPVSPPLTVSPPLPISPPPLPASPTYPLGFRDAMIRQRAEDVAPSTYILASRSETPPSGTLPLLPIPLPTSSSPLLLPSIDHRANKPEVCLPPRKRLCIALGPRYEVDESSSAPTARPTRGFRADYSFVATLDDEIRHDLERDDTDEIYGRLDETQDARAVLSGRLNLLQRDRPSHDYTTLLMKRETRLSREAWRQSMDASNTVRSEVRALRTTVLAQQTEMAALRAVTALQGQQGPASGLAQPEIPKEAGVTDALAARDANRNTNGDDSHNSGIGVRRTERVARECTYPDFMKCQPLNFKGTEGVVELI